MATYDPQAVRVFYGSLILHGYMDGTMIEVEKDEDTFSKHTGNDGETVRVRSRKGGGVIAVVLQQSSLSNSELSVLHAADELSGIAQQSVMVKDLRGTTLVAASEAWLKRYANITFGDTIEGRRWEIDCAKLNIIDVGTAVL